MTDTIGRMGTLYLAMRFGITGILPHTKMDGAKLISELTQPDKENIDTDPKSNGELDCNRIYSPP